MNRFTTLVQVGALSFVTLGLFSEAAMASLTVTPSNKGDALVKSILGDGIKLVPGSVKYTGAKGAAGTFKKGESAGIDIDSGLILTTGQAKDAVGANNSDSKTTQNGTIGDFQLNTLLPEGSGLTKDASSLEFKFTSDGGDLFFNYILASEEYTEYTGSKYNDVFGFFLDGTNIAVNPDTSIPVGINTVESSKFINNDPNDPGPAKYDIQYDGFTRRFRASAVGLTPGEHTIKLAIADVGDAKYDSAVFIESGTFSDQASPIVDAIPEPTTVTGLLVFAAIGARRWRGRLGS